MVGIGAEIYPPRPSGTPPRRGFVGCVTPQDNAPIYFDNYSATTTDSRLFQTFALVEIADKIRLTVFRDEFIFGLTPRYQAVSHDFTVTIPATTPSKLSDSI
jgi:hypothetical protein